MKRRRIREAGEEYEEEILEKQARNIKRRLIRKVPLEGNAFIVVSCRVYRHNVGCFLPFPLVFLFIACT